MVSNCSSIYYRQTTHSFIHSTHFYSVCIPVDYGPWKDIMYLLSKITPIHFHHYVCVCHSLSGHTVFMSLSMLSVRSRSTNTNNNQSFAFRRFANIRKSCERQIVQMLTRKRPTAGYLFVNLMPTKQPYHVRGDENGCTDSCLHASDELRLWRTARKNIT